MHSAYGRVLARASPSVGFSTLPLQCAAVARRHAAALFCRLQLRRYAVEAKEKLSIPKLNLPELEQKWRKRWAELDETKPSEQGDKGSKYILPMFPYPSGTLHLGHTRVYTIADVLARFHRMRGHDVMLPMGWDAFGLPAENAAIERGIDPAKWTRDNIASMKKQLEAMNGSWDWSREISTCDPEFYKHTQKIFLLLHEKGLAYRAEAEVNYDPVDKTVLANEQVDAQGFSWRSGAKVEKRRLKQWFLRISEYRDALLEDLEALKRQGPSTKSKSSSDIAWPDRVLSMQKNWLGKSTGAQVKFPVMSKGQGVHPAVEVFTTRPETLYGVQYVALAASHTIVTDLAGKDPMLQAFLDKLPSLGPESKEGYLLPNLRAINPLAYGEDSPDAVKQSLPVYVAPYVLGDYGEGAVMGVPAHDTRDHAFWRAQSPNEPIRVVLTGNPEEQNKAPLLDEGGPIVGPGTMTAHAGPLAGMDSREASKSVVDKLNASGLGEPIEKWRLRDWLVSRQRYWGAPIPIVHCESCGEVPVPDDQLPVRLPEVDGHWADRKPGNPLETAEDWVATSCPKCGDAARRDTDTMDTFVDSSWYFLRYADPHNAEEPFSPEKAAANLPVDIYIGGVEHAILHLLYARFIYKFLMETSSFARQPSDTTMEKHKRIVHEPFTSLVTQGMVHGRTCRDAKSGRILKPDEIDLSDPSTPKVAATGEPAEVTFEKMSKSKHNGVDPTEVIARYGADATRAHMIFQAPVEQVLDWDDKKIVGVTRWLGRLYDEIRAPVATERVIVDTTFSVKAYLQELAARQENQPLDPETQSRWEADLKLWRAVQQKIGSVTQSYETVFSLNTIVSDLMSLTNIILDSSSVLSAPVRAEALRVLLRMMAPITPAFAEECWSILHNQRGTAAALKQQQSPTSIFHPAVGFPVSDGTENDERLQPALQTCVIQVNNKRAGEVKIRFNGEDVTAGGMYQPEDWRGDAVVRQVLEHVDVQSKLKPCHVVEKVLVVGRGKLVKFVTKPGTT